MFIFSVVNVSGQPLLGRLKVKPDPGPDGLDKVLEAGRGRLTVPNGTNGGGCGLFGTTGPQYGGQFFTGVAA